MNYKKRTLVGVLTLFVLGFVLIAQFANSIVSLLEERMKRNAEDELLSELLLAKSNLESELFRDVFLVDSLATVFNIDPKEAEENFIEIGTSLLRKADNVRNVGIAPNDIIARNLPVEGNEKAIGLDFRTVPEQYATVLAARERGDIFLAGPVNLVQGGRGLIARIPIFNDYPKNNDYWGSISVVIDYDRLLIEAGLLDIKNTVIALRGVNGAGKNGAIFEGPAELFAEADYDGKLIVPNGEWWLAADFYPTLTQTQEWFLFWVRLGMLVVYVMLFGLVVLLWAFYRREKHLANEDVLTRIFNRRFAMEYLQRRFIEKKPKDQFCVVTIDLNYFKEINDNFGHDIGDHVLRVVASRLQDAVRSSDIVARTGGDEFLVIVNRMKDLNNLERVIEKIRNGIEGREIIIDDVSIQPSISIGVACSSEGPKSMERLLKIADARMYENKTTIKSVNASLDSA